MRGRRKVSHATQQQDRRKKRSPEQAARLDAVFKKPQSDDVDPLDDGWQLLVSPHLYKDP